MRDCGSIPHRDSTVSTLVGQPRRLKLIKNSLTLTKLLTQFTVKTSQPLHFAV